MIWTPRASLEGGKLGAYKFSQEKVTKKIVETALGTRRPPRNRLEAETLERWAPQGRSDEHLA